MYVCMYVCMYVFCHFLSFACLFGHLRLSFFCHFFVMGLFLSFLGLSFFVIFSNPCHFCVALLPGLCHYVAALVKIRVTLLF